MFKANIVEVVLIGSAPESQEPTVVLCLEEVDGRPEVGDVFAVNEVEGKIIEVAFQNAGSLSIPDAEDETVARVATDLTVGDTKGLRKWEQPEISGGAAGGKPSDRFNVFSGSK